MNLITLSPFPDQELARKRRKRRRKKKKRKKRMKKKSTKRFSGQPQRKTPVSGSPSSSDLTFLPLLCAAFLFSSAIARCNRASAAKTQAAILDSHNQMLELMHEFTLEFVKVKQRSDNRHASQRKWNSGRETTEPVRSHRVACVLFAISGDEDKIRKWEILSKSGEGQPSSHM